jgi:cystathionine beta-synthase
VTKYLSDEWMQQHGFLEPAPDLGLVEDLLGGLDQEIFVAREDDSVESLIELMRTHGVSQIPVVGDAGRPVSIVEESDLLRSFHRNGVTGSSSVRDAAQEIGGLIHPKARVEELFHIFESGRTAIVVDESRVTGVITRIDLIEFLARGKESSG